MNIEIGLLTLERKWYQRVLGDMITKNYRDVVNQKHKHFFQYHLQREYFVRSRYGFYQNSFANDR